MDIKMAFKYINTSIYCFPSMSSTAIAKVASLVSAFQIHQTVIHGFSVSFKSCRHKACPWKNKNDNQIKNVRLRLPSCHCHCNQNGGAFQQATTMEDGAVVVQDDLSALLEILPKDLRENLLKQPRRAELLEVVLDLGRRPEARFLGDGGGEFLRTKEISRQELEASQAAVGEFGGDNRAGIEGTLHRISAVRSRKGAIVGLTCRVGRAVTGHVDMVHDLLPYGESILFLGRPGVGKTTVMREIARVLADELHKRVVIVDTSNEIGGDGDIPHSAIGGARRMQVSEPSLQHKVMVEAVENHMPEVVIVDEIGTEAEALACRTIAERGVMLVGTAHGERLENLIKNPILCDLTERSVDVLLHGGKPLVEVRTRDENLKLVIERWKTYEGSKNRW